ncbi:hypothetical protein K469DRAFT_688338 [Zopfia rhizophila CBS 207.26]|uniref:Uncharacterized protein n=1 Tax=Zopfia rhizophila CBS 207.26 TaxID=1314779 RepID=A0A6A6DZN1_9PEZI|nr:hypothetical protein K469DRAFT_688338 [Zopfia rhizophila CBS 207.26]
MFPQEYEAALAAPDGNASYKRLYELTSSPGPARSASAADVAEKYLHAFCDNQNPVHKRRWVGIVLHHLIDLSKTAVAHLRTLPKELPRLGHVILQDTEMEETRIVAGIIIRQLLRKGIDFASFWDSGLVPNNAPRFPVESSQKWMEEFQRYLDDLEDIKILKKPDAGILYAVSVFASDSFKWRDTDAAALQVLFQNHYFTLITPESSVRDVGFIDIPIRHIHSTRIRKSALHDSQARTTEHEPWDIILTLKPGAWTYLVNASERTGREITILFGGAQDAKEAENCIKEATGLLPQTPRMSSSQALDISRSDESNPKEGVSSKRPAQHNGSQPPKSNVPSQDVLPIESANLRKQTQSTLTNGSLSTQNLAPTNEAVGQGVQNGDTQREKNINNAGSSMQTQPKSATGSLPPIKEPPRMSEAGLRDNAGGGQPNECIEPSKKTQRKSAPGALPSIKKLAHKRENTNNNTLNVNKDQGNPIKSIRSSKQSQGRLSIGAFPPIQKRTHVSETMSRSNLMGDKDQDEYGFPDSLPRMQRSLQMTKKGQSSIEPKGTATTPRIGENFVVKPSPTKPEPTLTPKIVPMQHINDIEDDPDPLSAEIAQPSSIALSRSSQNARIAEPSSAQGVNVEWHGEDAKPDTKPSGLPNGSSEKEPKKSSNKKRGNDDVYDIPMDDEPKRKRRSKREAAKSIGYDERESSECGGSESDYVETTTTKRSTNKKTSGKKGTTNAKARRPAASQVKTKNQKAKGRQAETQLISPAKHPVIGKMLSKSQPMTNSEVSEVKKGNEDVDKGSLAESDRVEAVEEESPVPILPAISSPLPDTKVQGPGRESSHPMDGDEIGVKQSSQISSPLDHKLVTNSFGSQSGVLAHATTSKDRPALASPANRSTVLADPTPPKRPVESFAPTTPDPKRINTVDVTTQAKEDAGKSGFMKPAMTIAPTRLINDPSSPCPTTKRLQQESRQPSAGQTMNNLLYSMVHSQEEVDEVPQAGKPAQYNPTPVVGIKKRPVKRNTPPSKNAQRKALGGLTNAEIISSNSKPIPASPHAESTAISGHVPGHEVEMDKQIAVWETAGGDPFKDKSNKPRLTAFTRRCTEESVGVEPELPPSSSRKEPPVENARDFSDVDLEASGPKSLQALMMQVPSQMEKTLYQVKANMMSKHRQLGAQLSSRIRSREENLQESRDMDMENSGRNLPQSVVEEMHPQEVYAQDDGDMYRDGGKTLVVPEEDLLPDQNASPIYIQSSPPAPYIPSSHSSTSAEQVREPSSVSDEEAEEMEWEASLQPHQRAIGDQLTRISRRILRHIVDNETAVNDIVEQYAKDGERLLTLLLEEHKENLNTLFEGIDEQKDGLRGELTELAKRLVREREQFNEPGVQRSRDDQAVSQRVRY